MERFGVTVNAIAPRARTRMTESIGGGGLGDPEAAGFDEWHPDNIAPVVGWLASDAAAEVSGQIFVVFGGRVHLLQGFTEQSAVKRSERWTVEGLIEGQEDLFVGRRSKVPGFGIGF
jgi:hypothetical protein